MWFSYSSFQQVWQPSIPSPVKEDTSKIWDTTGTDFIQGPSILLLVWRSIMFNGSFLWLCRILRFVKKIRFCILESGPAKPWCPGLVSRPSAKSSEPLARSRGPSILLLVWRSIMFNGSFLRVCMILRFVKKIWFCLLESVQTKPWCPGLVSRPSAKA